MPPTLCTSLATSRKPRRLLGDELVTQLHPNNDTESSMKFVVKPASVNRFPITTHCVLCSEDPRWCPPAS